MTDEQVEICALGWETLLSETDRPRWFAVEPGFLPAAHELAERGWLERRKVPSGDSPEWRLSEEGFGALRLSAAGELDPARMN